MTNDSLMAQMVKHLPAMQETWVQSLGPENPLEKEMATHSTTLAWRIPWMEEPGRLQSTGLQSRTQLSKFSFSLMTNEVEHPVGHLYVFFGELFKFFAQFQKLHYHFTVDLQEFFVNPDISPLLDIQFADIFSHSMGFLFYFFDGIF